MDQRGRLLEEVAREMEGRVKAFSPAVIDVVVGVEIVRCRRTWDSISQIWPRWAARRTSS